MYKIRRFFGKIKKIFEYMPILWRDEDWDYEYLLDLIKFKINRIKNTISKNKAISNRDIREICIGINQTISHINNYQNPDMYERINGGLNFSIRHEHHKLPNGYYQLITYNDDENRPLTEEEDKIYSELISNKIKFEQDEWNLIFDTIKKEGQKWWD